MGWGDQGRKHQTRVSQAELITSPACCMPEEGHSRRFKREVAMTAAPQGTDMSTGDRFVREVPNSEVSSYDSSRLSRHHVAYY